MLRLAVARANECNAAKLTQTLEICRAQPLRFTLTRLRNNIYTIISIMLIASVFHAMNDNPYASICT
jgi:hypothetical protein